jgi:hypothetical protein
MSEVVHERTVVLVGDDGSTYTLVRACARAMGRGGWEGWLEFVPADGPIVVTQRETTQSKLADVAYWAEGLEAIYLEGALHRALETPAPAQ